MITLQVRKPIPLGGMPPGERRAFRVKTRFPPVTSSRGLSLRNLGPRASHGLCRLLVAQTKTSNYRSSSSGSGSSRSSRGFSLLQSKMQCPTRTPQGVFGCKSSLSFKGRKKSDRHDGAANKHGMGGDENVRTPRRQGSFGDLRARRSTEL